MGISTSQGATENRPDVEPGDEGGTNGAAVQSCLRQAAWLSDNILLLTGDLPFDGAEVLQGQLIGDGESMRLGVRALSYREPDRAGCTRSTGTLMCLCLPGAGSTMPEQIAIQAGATTYTFGALELTRALTDLRSLLRAGPAGLDADTRARIVAFLAASPAEYQGRTDHKLLSINLGRARNALRERLPGCVTWPTHPRGLHIEAICAIDERSFYARGWMRDDVPITRLSAVSPEGSRIELLDSLFSYPRPDLSSQYENSPTGRRDAEMGFVAYFESDQPGYLAQGWIVEMANAEGLACEVEAPPAAGETGAIRDTILADLAHERGSSEELMSRQVHPALRRLQERRSRELEVAQTLQYGGAPDNPEISIVVPLYGRIDFVEHQLAQFVYDPEAREVDLIYVLDSPELADELRNLAAGLYELYRVPFRVIILKQNGGFSPASNAGAAVARGRLLLLLNSDVLPDKPGWLGTMARFYDSRVNAGALAPKLLYEDGSLQHAGMYFQRRPHSLSWSVEHYYKGLHRDIEAANYPRTVPAVTAACLMIDRGLFSRLSGLRGMYVQGGFEDADLCLRLTEAGYENWYLPDAALFHLEGQSYPATLRETAGKYNRWLFNQLWDERLDALAQYTSNRGALR